MLEQTHHRAPRGGGRIMILDLLAVAAVFLGVAVIVGGFVAAVAAGDWLIALIIAAAVAAGVWLVRSS